MQHQLPLPLMAWMGHRRGDDCPHNGFGRHRGGEGVSALSVEDEKRRARAQAVGLFRYQLICPALDAGLSTKARGRLVRQIASREHTDPFGTPVRYSRDTLDRWIRRYRAGGFAELVPSPRTCVPRTDTATMEMAAALKRENPARTAAQVARILRAASGWAPSESTLLRLFHRCELIGPAAGDTAVVFGRFEAENPNERWTGDALHGPRIGGRKTYLFAFLDDHSRLICGYRFGFAEDAVRLGAALQPALAARRLAAHGAPWTWLTRSPNTVCGPATGWPPVQGWPAPARSWPSWPAAAWGQHCLHPLMSSHCSRASPGGPTPRRDRDSAPGDLSENCRPSPACLIQHHAPEWQCLRHACTSQGRQVGPHDSPAPRGQ